MTDLILRRLAKFFHENATAHSFLAQDGDGGYLAAIAGMAREIEQLRKVKIAEMALRSQLKPPPE